jgi:hypothetical protein
MNKLSLYEQAGVNEYVAVLVSEQEVRWHRLVAGAYQVIPAPPDGVLRSQVFPGLWLDGAALLHHDSARLLATLHQGLASPEHQAFVASLAQQRNP